MIIIMMATSVSTVPIHLHEYQTNKAPRQVLFTISLILGSFTLGPPLLPVQYLRKLLFVIQKCEHSAVTVTAVVATVVMTTSYR